MNFSISTSVAESGFTLLPLTDDRRQELGLPKGTLRYIEVDDPTDPAIGQDGITFWLDEEILARLGMVDSSGTRWLQRQLFIDAMSAIVREGLRSHDLDRRSLADLDGTLLARVVDLVAGAHGTVPKRAEAFEQLINDPGRFVASIEHRVPDFKKDLANTLAEVAS